MDSVAYTQHLQKQIRHLSFMFHSSFSTFPISPPWCLVPHCTDLGIMCQCIDIGSQIVAIPSYLLQPCFQSHQCQPTESNLSETGLEEQLIPLQPSLGRLCAFLTPYSVKALLEPCSYSQISKQASALLPTSAYCQHRSFSAGGRQK